MLKDLDAGWSVGNAYTETSGKPIPAYINYAQANGKHEWWGFYDDISASQSIDNRTNWDCIDTARWLVAHRTENPDYLPLAIQLNDWIVKNFADTTDAWAPAEGIREQKVCFATMGIHTAHWAALMTDLLVATGEAAFKSRALNACALVTYWMRPDNSKSVGPTWGTETWFSCQFVQPYTPVRSWAFWRKTPRSKRRI